MLFHSYAYLFFFLPAVFLIYFFLHHYRYNLSAKFFLLSASIYFYAQSNLVNLLRLLLLSMIFNFWLGQSLAKDRTLKNTRKQLLIFGLFVNIASLVYFKYMDFFIQNINTLFGTELPFLYIALPLGISFFTFQEIAYLIDSYYGKTKEYSFINYALFVAFFPQLIAGPIVHHREMMEQFGNKSNYTLRYDNIARGLFIFAIGIFKKVVLADTFSIWATNGFDNTTSLTLIEAWTTSLSYTLQLYFDFSGYTDMAIGSALMFNITLPINFNSPYRALNIQDFWRRWHITLSRFFRDYIYIPLGGNRDGTPRTLSNLFIVFLIGGIWHGAGWTFVAWGILHGLAMMIHFLWKQLNLNTPKALSWILTFMFVNSAWVFFRAHSFNDALKVLKGMTGFSGIKLPEQFATFFPSFSSYGIEFSRQILSTIETDSALKIIIWLGLGLTLALYTTNSADLTKNFRPSLSFLIISILIFFSSLYYLGGYSEFIYFNF